MTNNDTSYLALEVFYGVVLGIRRLTVNVLMMQLTTFQSSNIHINTFAKVIVLLLLKDVTNTTITF